MSYVINPTGRSRRRRRGCGCGSGCGGCGGGCGGCGGCGCGAAARVTQAAAPYMSSLLYRPEICSCPCGCPEPYLRNVVYSGPCPPCPDDPCQPPLPPPPPDPPCYPPFPAPLAYAYYAQDGALSVARGGDRVQMNAVREESPDAFQSAEGMIRILRPGTYQAAFSMALPAEAVADARLRMTLDGETLPGSGVSVRKGAGAPGSVYAQTLIQVLQPGAVLEVISDAPIALAGQPGDTLASLTVTQIGPAQ